MSVGTDPVVSDVGRDTVAFTDRPQRLVSALSTTGLVATWKSLFEGDPPNVAVSGHTADGRETWVVTVTGQPTMTPDRTLRLPVRLVGEQETATPTEPAGPLSDVTVTVDGATPPTDCGWIAIGWVASGRVTMDVDAPGWDQPITLTFGVASPILETDVTAVGAFGGRSLVTGSLDQRVVTVPAPSTWATAAPAGQTPSIDVTAEVSARTGSTSCGAGLSFPPA